MGFAVRVRSAGQKYGPTCHQRDRADVTEFVTLVRLSSLGQHVGVLALAGYKRRKSALTANPIVSCLLLPCISELFCLFQSFLEKPLISHNRWVFKPTKKSEKDQHDTTVLILSLKSQRFDSNAVKQQMSVANSFMVFASNYHQCFTISFQLVLGLQEGFVPSLKYRCLLFLLHECIHIMHTVYSFSARQQYCHHCWELVVG